MLSKADIFPYILQLSKEKLLVMFYDISLSAESIHLLDKNLTLKSLGIKKDYLFLHATKTG